MNGCMDKDGRAGGLDGAARETTRICRKRLAVANGIGLDLRAAGKLAHVARQFEAEIVVQRDDSTANAKSLLDLVSLRAADGSRVTVVANGGDAAEAVRAIQRLFADAFREGHGPALLDRGESAAAVRTEAGWGATANGNGWDEDQAEDSVTPGPRSDATPDEQEETTMKKRTENGSTATMMARPQSTTTTSSITMSAPIAAATTFVCESKADAKQAYLAGDFNNWDPKAMPMLKQGSRFETRIPLRPGEHQYKFIVDGQWLNDPKAWKQVPNRFGTMNSVVHV